MKPKPPLKIEGKRHIVYLQAMREQLNSNHVETVRSMINEEIKRIHKEMFPVKWV